MSDPADFPARVGRQLAQRRKDLDLTQIAIAQSIGITTNAVSQVERGLNTISLKNRSAWEETLRLPPGTISRAYRTGELTDEPGVPGEDVDLNELMQDPEARAALRTIIRRIKGTPPDPPDSPKRDKDVG